MAMFLYACTVENVLLPSWRRMSLRRPAPMRYAVRVVTQ